MLIVGPTVKGQRINLAPVSHVDLIPTILESLSIKIPPHVQGRSLVPILQGMDTIKGRRFVFAEHNSHGPNHLEHYPQRVVTNGNWYYVLNINPSKTQLLPADLRGESIWGNYAYSAIKGAIESHPFQAWFLERFAKPRQQEHLFQLDIDPWGLNDLAMHESTKAVMEEMRTVMSNWRNKTKDITKSPLEILNHDNF